MLLILIPISWFAVVLLFVAVCNVAAKGDRGVGTPEPDESPVRLAPGVVIWDEGVAPMQPTRRIRRAFAGRRVQVHPIERLSRRPRPRRARAAADGTP